MATIFKGSIDLTSLPFTIVKEMENELGEVEEYVCIPVKSAGLKRKKTSIWIYITVFPSKIIRFLNTHYIYQSLPKKEREKGESMGVLSRVLGGGRIEFKYLEQKEMKRDKETNVNYLRDMLND